VERLEDRALLSSGPALAAAYGQLPITFEENQGQAAADVDYVAHASGYTLSLDKSGATLDLHGSSTGKDSLVRLELVGVNGGARAVSLDPAITRTNYFLGSDPRQWHTNIPNFGRVEYAGVYSGINLDYYSNHGQLEYDFVVAPGADASAIQMSIRGADAAINAQGNLIIHTPAGDVVEQAPVVYQEINGVRQQIAAGIQIVDSASASSDHSARVTFQLGAYDHTHGLVIDPILVYYATDPRAGVGFGIAADSKGDAYFTGGNGEVGKLNRRGNELIYLTFLGNGGMGDGIAVDSSGNAYVIGAPGSNFPTTPNAFSTTPSDLFVTKLGPTGANLLYSTYVPGGEGNYISALLGAPGGIAFDGSGNIYVTGDGQAGLATTPGAFQTTYSGSDEAFFAEFNPNLSGSASLLYSSYLGGGTNEGTGIAVDSSGNAYLSGITGPDFPTTAGAYQTTWGGGLDVFVAKFNPTLWGSASLAYSTFLGGTGQNGYVTGTSGSADPFLPGPGIAVDSAGEAFIAGQTGSTRFGTSDFPTTPGAFQTTFGGPTSGRASDGFVTKLNAAGSALVYSTFLGGSDQDALNGIAVDSSGNATVTGWTLSTDFPTMNPIQANNSGGYDAVVATLNASGSALLFSTYLGSANDDLGCAVALGPRNFIYVTGYTRPSFTGFAYMIALAYAPNQTSLGVDVPSLIVPVQGLTADFVPLPLVAGGNFSAAPVAPRFSRKPINENQNLSSSGPSIAISRTNPPIFAAGEPESRQSSADTLYASDPTTASLDRRDES
jgi:hypothetical protein